MSSLEVIILIVGIIGSALYSGMETGVVSVNRLRLQHLVRRKWRGAETIQRFLDQPDHLLGTTLVGTNLCNVAVSVTSASMFVHMLGASGLWVASLVSTLVLLILGEYLPKAWFRGYPAYRVIPFAGALQWSGYLFYPLSMGVMRLARLLIPGRTGEEEKKNPFITREELQFLAREGEKSGELSTEERRMMHGVLELSHKTCADIMVPRERMVTVAPDTPTQTLLEAARNKQVSRLPIYDESSRRFTGLVHIMDVLIDDRSKGRTAKAYARPPQYVAADSRADQLLPRMRLTRQPLALVQDERKHVIGLVSIEDVLEEIVGKM